MTSVATLIPTWPEPDQAMWRGLTKLAGPFDNPGALSELKPVSIEKLIRAYSQWLKWLATYEPEALVELPTVRATVGRLQGWLGDQAALGPTSRFMLVRHVLRILRAAGPGADWRMQRQLEAYLRLLAGNGDPERKRGRILSSAVLLDVGLRHAASGEAAAPLEAAKRLRDGLMVATLALMPVRIGSFRILTLGRSCVVTAEEIVFALNEDQTKTGAPWEAPVPAVLEPLMRRYLAETRPWLMAQWGERHDVLWVNDRGRSYADTYLGQKIATVTTRLTGIRVPPHFFRDSAATTLARLSPRASKLIHPVLGHSDFRMAQKHYNHATALEAGRDYAAVIARMKREAK